MSYQKLLDSIDKELQLCLLHGTTDPETLAAVLERHQDLNAQFLSFLPEIIFDLKLPEQTFSSQAFSQFPFTILNVGSLNLDIYHWNGVNTSIHNHNFNGAFKVLYGKFNQENYHFQKHEQVSDWLATGELKMINQQRLEANKVTPISSGEEFIHATYHRQECITACLRVREATGSIFSYIKPSLKMRHVGLDIHTLKALDYLSFLNLNLTSNEKKILFVFHRLPSSVLFQILFAINMPAWISGAYFRTLAKKQLEKRHSGEAWLRQVDLCIVEEKLQLSD